MKHFSVKGEGMATDEQRIIKLEEQVAFLEHNVEELSRVTLDLNEQLLELQRQVDRLRRGQAAEANEVEPEESSSDQPPT
jgi:uncharacterized coiled-coil protein SlyX